jgi:hypothetical protein
MSRYQNLSRGVQLAEFRTSFGCVLSSILYKDLRHIDGVSTAIFRPTQSTVRRALTLRRVYYIDFCSKAVTILFLHGDVFVIES